MHAIKPWASTLILSFAITCEAAHHTYWVDKSCSNRVGWDTWMAEAFKMSQRASERLVDSTDTDFANTFKRVYSTDKSSKTLYDRSDSYKKYRKNDVGFKAQDTAYNIVYCEYKLTPKIYYFL